ncbi:MAG: cytochrome c3 family protein [Phycisphaerae bacterium]|nr:cytochrome c3 family protein [Phycisphaerae bacterium]
MQCVVVAAAVGGCAAGTRERLKHFLFEVPASQPAEDARPPSQIRPPAEPFAASSTPFVSFHPPFRDRQCAQCHDSRQGQLLIEPWAERCAACHSALFAPRPFLHGPAAAIACNECHLPHASSLPTLLRQRDPDLCLVCHDPTYKLNERHHRDRSTPCASCHDPHAGDDRRLLRPEFQRRTRAAPGEESER